MVRQKRKVHEMHLDYAGGSSSHVTVSELAASGIDEKDELSSMPHLKPGTFALPLDCMQGPLDMSHVLGCQHGSGSCTDTVFSPCTHRCSVALIAVVGAREGRVCMKVCSQVSIALFKKASVHRCVHN